MTRARKARDRQAYWRLPRVKARVSAYGLKRRYGITVEQRDEMLSAQGGKCALCARVLVPQTHIGPRNIRTEPCVDHSPEGKVRGILCHACNRGKLGAYERGRNNGDNAKYEEYLRRYE